MATSREATGGVITVDEDANDDDEIIDADDIDQAPSKKTAPAKKAKAKSLKKRVVWAKIVVTAANGKKSYPFLHDENYQDVYLVRVLLANVPYKAGYGQTIKEWDNSSLILSEQMDPTGKLVFQDGISTRTLKLRFEELMKFVKKYEGNVPFRSGEDNEGAPNELQSGIEDIYEDWCSFEDSKLTTSNNNVAQQKLEKEQAEQIRKASVGEMSRAELQRTLATTAGTTPTAASSKNNSGSASSSGGRGTPSHELDQIRSQLLNRLQSNDAFESIEDRANRKKQKFDLQQQRANQEQQRLDLEKQRVANEQQRVANEHEQRTQQMKMNELMMKFLVESQNAQGKNNKRSGDESS
jgi:hypothetical protein